MTMQEAKMIAVGSRPSWEKALEFARAVGSVVTHAGFVDEATYKTRLSSCQSCEKLDRGAGDGQVYCGECDCGRWPLSRIDNKLRFPALDCPLGRAGFANAGKVDPSQPIERRKCEGCSKPEPDRSLIPIGAKVLITARMPNEEPDLRPWTVEGHGQGVGVAAPTVYDLRRRRRFLTWDWLRHWGRPERATVSRDAIARAGAISL